MPNAMPSPRSSKYRFQALGPERPRSEATFHWASREHVGCPPVLRVLSCGMPAAKHTPRASRVETVQIVLPGLTNTHGTIFGGMLMQWIDIAAAVSAGRHASGPVVTAAMDSAASAYARISTIGTCCR